MDNPQIIRSPKGEEMVILSRADYDRLARLAADDDCEDGDDYTPEEDARDIAYARDQIAKIKAGKLQLVPASVVYATTIHGVHPVKAWREHRGWTGEQLAKKSKLARTTISQIESGKRKGTVAAYKALAKALGVTVTSLILD